MADPKFALFNASGQCHTLCIGVVFCLDFVGRKRYEAGTAIAVNQSCV